MPIPSTWAAPATSSEQDHEVRALDALWSSILATQASLFPASAGGAPLQKVSSRAVQTALRAAWIDTATADARAPNASTAEIDELLIELSESELTRADLVALMAELSSRQQRGLLLVGQTPPTSSSSSSGAAAAASLENLFIIPARVSLGLLRGFQTVLAAAAALPELNVRADLRAVSVPIVLVASGAQVAIRGLTSAEEGRKQLLLEASLKKDGEGVFTRRGLIAALSALLKSGDITLTSLALPQQQLLKPLFENFATTEVTLQLAVLTPGSAPSATEAVTLDTMTVDQLKSVFTPQIKGGLVKGEQVMAVVGAGNPHITFAKFLDVIGSLDAAQTSDVLEGLELMTASTISRLQDYFSAVDTQGVGGLGPKGIQDLLVRHLVPFGEATRPDDSARQELFDRAMKEVLDSALVTDLAPDFVAKLPPPARSRKVIELIFNKFAPGAGKKTSDFRSVVLSYAKAYPQLLHLQGAIRKKYDNFLREKGFSVAAETPKSVDTVPTSAAVATSAVAASDAASSAADAHAKADAEAKAKDAAEAEAQAKAKADAAARQAQEAADVAAAAAAAAQAVVQQKAQAAASSAAEKEALAVAAEHAESAAAAARAGDVQQAEAAAAMQRQAAAEAEKHAAAAAEAKRQAQVAAAAATLQQAEAAAAAAAQQQAEAAAAAAAAAAQQRAEAAAAAAAQQQAAEQAAAAAALAQRQAAAAAAAAVSPPATKPRSDAPVSGDALEQKRQFLLEKLDFEAEVETTRAELAAKLQQADEHASRILDAARKEALKILAAAKETALSAETESGSTGASAKRFKLERDQLQLEKDDLAKQAKKQIQIARDERDHALQQAEEAVRKGDNQRRELERLLAQTQAVLEAERKKASQRQHLAAKQRTPSRSRSPTSFSYMSPTSSTTRRASSERSIRNAPWSPAGSTERSFEESNPPRFSAKDRISREEFDAFYARQMAAHQRKLDMIAAKRTARQEREVRLLSEGKSWSASLRDEFAERSQRSERLVDMPYVSPNSRTASLLNEFQETYGTPRDRELDRQDEYVAHLKAVQAVGSVVDASAGRSPGGNAAGRTSRTTHPSDRHQYRPSTRDALVARAADLHHDAQVERGRSSEVVSKLNFDDNDGYPLPSEEY